ncbi:hypothetical protein QQ054_01075 [Oscillatoria amoena NRMC-F 0135]|nr:hypothetical protein [Oscillatoria amoena NRMC-F 0135]
MKKPVLIVVIVLVLLIVAVVVFLLRKKVNNPFPLKKGDKGNLISILQSSLKIPITGEYDQVTAIALAAYFKVTSPVNELSETGFSRVTGIKGNDLLELLKKQ